MWCAMMRLVEGRSLSVFHSSSSIHLFPYPNPQQSNKAPSTGSTRQMALDRLS
ncbi:hypothetical protein P154DRAFT_521945 [Amniculicola lignicola CBS 123094]|uniref:Uncharacterized protein n=1 Tax=Amniculicola lignicola CBS 123094 TaxID=1392246 RepID=A0A6A5WM69_9PLEO|nr:hypothetical protein P154DRAFT_521945 [Amniculicola lignicola CBS 123094]